MKNNIEQPWIEAGYKIFSSEGPAGLKVDQIARKVGISRSSFYHLFADLDIFREKLLAYHAERAKLGAEKVKLCKAIDPDLLLLILEEKDYVLFNRQLRIHRDNPVFKASFENALAVVAKENMMNIWGEMLGLQHSPHVTQNIFKITADIFFHRLTEENMNYEWLEGFLKEIKLFIKEVNEKNLREKKQG